MVTMAANQHSTAEHTTGPGLRAEPQPARTGRAPAAHCDRGAVLWLASQSPRRSAILRDAGIAHRVLPISVDDSHLSTASVPPAALVMALAYFKARAGVEALRAVQNGPALARPEGGDVVLGADTICVLDGRVIGKPTDAHHARRMIAAFANRPHDVLTGVAIIDGRSGERSMFFDRALVRVGQIGSEALDTYVASGEWAGKAGGYNLTERAAAGWPIRVEGKPTTVVGLPIEATIERLSRHGIMPSLLAPSCGD